MKKARFKFLRMFKAMPKQARHELVLDAFTGHPYTLNVVYIEVKNDTKLGKKFISKLGFDDDKEEMIS